VSLRSQRLARNADRAAANCASSRILRAGDVGSFARCASSSFTGGVEYLEEIRSRKESAEAQLRPRENEKQVRCARGEVVHRELEQQRTRRRNDPWPENIGIAEHSFRRDPVQKQTEYWSLFVDHVGGATSHSRASNRRTFSRGSRTVRVSNV
jgi:hypothetical protein